MDKQINEELFIQYQNKWVLADRDYSKIYAASSNLEVLQKKAKKIKESDAVIMYIPAVNSSLSPCLY